MSDSARLAEIHSEVLNYYTKADDFVSEICQGELSLSEAGDAHQKLRQAGLSLRSRLGGLANSSAGHIVAQCELVDFISRTVLVPIGLAAKNHSERMANFQGNPKYTAEKLEQIRTEDAARKIARIQDALQGWNSTSKPFLDAARREAMPYVFDALSAPKKSRAKEEHEVTKFVRKNLRHHNNVVSDTVRRFMELNDIDEKFYKAYYSYVDHDTRRNPLSKAKKKR